MNIELSQECLEAIRILEKGMNAAKAEKEAEEELGRFVDRNRLLEMRRVSPGTPAEMVKEFIYLETVRSTLGIKP